MAIATTTESRYTVVAKSTGVSTLEVATGVSVAVIPKSAGQLGVAGDRTLVVGGGKTEVIAAKTQQVVALDSPIPTVISVGVQGPEGFGNLTGGVDTSISQLAAEPLSANTPVISDGLGALRPAFGSQVGQVGQLLGLTGNAASTGGIAKVLQVGRVENAAWAWIPGPIFLGEGIVTQTPPTSGILQILAMAISPTELVIHVNQPFII